MIYLYIITGIILLLIIIIFIESHREIRRFKIIRYDIVSDKLPKTENGINAVFISDFHDALFDKDNSKLVYEIDKLNPDIILIGGDMVVTGKVVSCDNAVNFLNTLSDKYPVYYGMGNHELRMMYNTDKYGDIWNKYIKRLNSNIKLLHNTAEEIYMGDKKINIYSLDLDRKYYKRFKLTDMDSDYINNKIGFVETDTFNILLAHNPDYFPAYASWNADLSLSGHVHGGLIRLPLLGGILSPRIIFFPKYDKGLFKISDKSMIVSGGLGSHSVNIRFNNIPEIINIKLLNKY